jgi:hypothetical protein
MRRSTNFLIAATATLITFATLHYAIGPKQFGWHGHSRHAYGSYDHNYPCGDDQRTNSKDKGTEKDAESNEF